MTHTAADGTPSARVKLTLVPREEGLSERGNLHQKRWAKPTL